VDRPPLARSAGSGRAALWRNYAIMVYTAIVLAALMVVLNLIIFDHNVRFDLTPTKRFTLSPFDKRVLENLNHDVKVMCFVRTEDPEYKELAELLFRAAAFTPRVSYQIIDVNKSPGLARQYGVSSYGEVVVESEGRRRDFDNARSDILIPAILQVTHEANKKLYFTAGHGERDVFDTNREMGYSALSQALQQNNYALENVSLFASGVPDDASIVVILGPRKDFLPEELAALAHYLARGGKLLVMLDPYGAPSLAAFLKLYHVAYIEQVIVDPAYRLSAGEILTTQIPLRAEDNVITRSMVAPAVFSMARGVGVDAPVGASAPDGLRLQRESVLLRSSHESWASGDDKAVTTGITAYKPGRDLKGPVPVGVEVDLAPPDKAHLPVLDMTRIVAFGDSDFAANQFFEMLGNRDLIVNAINELAGDEILIASREKINAAQTAAFYVSDQQARRAFTLGVVVEPMALFAIGLAVFVRRRFFA
jgi:gliding motility-associatede transport system auxiliary component